MLSQGKDLDTKKQKVHKQLSNTPVCSNRQQVIPEAKFEAFFNSENKMKVWSFWCEEEQNFSPKKLNLLPRFKPSAKSIKANSHFRFLKKRKKVKISLVYVYLKKVTFVTSHAKTYTNGFVLNGQKPTANQRVANGFSNGFLIAFSGCAKTFNGL